MKSKLYLCLILFSIWTMFNMVTTLILHLAMSDSYFASLHWINFIAAFILSFVAVLSGRYFSVIIIIISLATACCLIPGLSHGDITGDNGFIQVGNINNALFVHNEFLLILNMNLFYEHMPINRAIVLSDAIIILLSGCLMICIQDLAIRLHDVWIDDEDAYTAEI